MNIAKGRLDQFINWLVNCFKTKHIVTKDTYDEEFETSFTNRLNRLTVVAVETGNISLSANGGTQWVSVTGPTGFIALSGYYVFNGANTRVNVYRMGTTGTGASFALANLATTATTVKLNVEFLCYR